MLEYRPKEKKKEEEENENKNGGSEWFKQNFYRLTSLPIIFARLFVGLTSLFNGFPGSVNLFTN